MFHNARGITSFSNYVLHEKSLHTVPNLLIEAPLHLTLTPSPQAKLYIFGNTTNMFHNGRGITSFSNYVLDQKIIHPPSLHTMPNTKSRIETGGPPNQIF